MINVNISDITLREQAKSGSITLSFKEKIEIAKQLDRLNIDVIETAPITNGKTDVLYLHTIAPIISNSILSCPVELNAESIDTTFDAIKNAFKPRLHIMVPVSTVQMEYMCHKKPKGMLELIEELVAKAKSLTNDVEVSFIDATRAESEFLHSAIRTAIEKGATVVTLCDTAGTMLPAEFEGFITDTVAAVPEIANVTLSVECSDELGMAVACAISCIKAGVTQIKTNVISSVCPSLSAIAKTFRAKADSLGVTTNVNMTIIDNSIARISPAGFGTRISSDVAGDVYDADFKLTGSDDIKTLEVVIAKMGYELSEEDLKRVYDEFVKLSKNRNVGTKEIDAIIASVAMQVPPTYKLNCYVINNGNIITPTAQVELEHFGELKQGFCIGDGPVDAAFRAIEQITGKHYELDDYQVHSVTEGRDSMGATIIKLRSNGKLYSGKGISTDVIGASINAYMNALNKICFEEGE